MIRHHVKSKTAAEYEQRVFALNCKLEEFHKIIYGYLFCYYY